MRAVAIVDGEHYADVVRHALSELPYDFAAAVLVGGQEKLRDAAEETPDILARAERNTRLMLVGLLEALGFTSVSIEFVDVTP